MSDLVKDRECIHCNKFFECKGKPRGTLCVNIEERNDEKWDKKKDTSG